MDCLNKLIEFLGKVKTLSLAKRLIFVLTVVLALLFFLVSCSSHRSFSVSVDKAEKVEVNNADSIDAVWPF